MQVAALTLKWVALPAAAEVAPYMPVDSPTLQLEGMELQLKVVALCIISAFASPAGVQRRLALSFGLPPPSPVRNYLCGRQQRHAVSCQPLLPLQRCSVIEFQSLACYRLLLCSSTCVTDSHPGVS